MNLLQSIPARVRIALYLVYAVAGPVLIYTATRGWTGEAEYALYVGLGTAFGLTAAANVPAVYAARHDATPEQGDGYASGVSHDS